MLMNRKQYFESQVEALLQELLMLEQTNGDGADATIDIREKKLRRERSMNPPFHVRSVEDVKDMLLTIEPSPLKVEWVDKYGPLRIVFDEITVLLEEQLLRIEIEYYNDMNYLLNEADLFETDEIVRFVCELNKRVPIWNCEIHKLERRSNLVANAVELEEQEVERIKQTIKNSYLDINEDELRLDFFHVKAARMAAEEFGRKWIGKPTMAKFFKACLAIGMMPPIAEWTEEFDQLVEQCKNREKEFEESRARRLKEQMKREHQMVLMQKKLQVQFDSMDLVEDLRFHVSILEPENGNLLKENFCVTMTIFNNHSLDLDFTVPFEDVDVEFPKLFAFAEEMNEEVPALGEACKRLKKEYSFEGIYFYPYAAREEPSFPYRIKRKRNYEVVTKGLPITKKVRRINEMSKGLWHLINIDDILFF